MNADELFDYIEKNDNGGQGNGQSKKKQENKNGFYERWSEGGRISIEELKNFQKAN